MKKIIGFISGLLIGLAFLSFTGAWDSNFWSVISNGALQPNGNIALGDYWLSGDGGNEGIQIDENGKIGFGKVPGPQKFTLQVEDNVGGVLYNFLENGASSDPYTIQDTVSSFSGVLTTYQMNTLNPSSLFFRAYNASDGKTRFSVNALGVITSVQADTLAYLGPQTAGYITTLRDAQFFTTDASVTACTLWTKINGVYTYSLQTIGGR